MFKEYTYKDLKTGRYFNTVENSENIAKEKAVRYFGHDNIKLFSSKINYSKTMYGINLKF